MPRPSTDGRSGPKTRAWCSCRSAGTVIALVTIAFSPAAGAAQPAAADKPARSSGQTVCEAIALQIRRTDQAIESLIEMQKSAPARSAGDDCDAQSVQRAPGGKRKAEKAAGPADCMRRASSAKADKPLLGKEQAASLIAEHRRERESDAKGFEQRRCEQYGLRISAPAPQ